MESFRGCVAPAQGARSSRGDTAQAAPRPEGCAERGARPAGQDPRPRTKGPAPAGPGSRAPPRGAGGAGPACTPGTDPCPDLDSSPCPARSPDAGPDPDPGSRPEPTWSAVVGGAAARPQPQTGVRRSLGARRPREGADDRPGASDRAGAGRTLSAQRNPGQPSAPCAARAQSRPAGAETLAPPRRRHCSHWSGGPATGADWTSAKGRRLAIGRWGCPSLPITAPRGAAEAGAPAGTYAAVARAAGRPLPAAFEDVPRPCGPRGEPGRPGAPSQDLGRSALSSPPVPGYPPPAPAVGCTPCPPIGTSCVPHSSRGSVLLLSRFTDGKPTEARGVERFSPAVGHWEEAVGPQPSPSGRSPTLIAPPFPLWRSEWVGPLGERWLFSSFRGEFTTPWAPPTQQGPRDWLPSLTQAADGGWKESEFREGGLRPWPITTGPRSPVSPSHPPSTWLLASFVGPSLGHV